MLSGTEQGGLLQDPPTMTASPHHQPRHHSDMGTGNAGRPGGEQSIRAGGVSCWQLPNEAGVKPQQED